MNVEFFTISKRHNSTKQPTGGATKSCKLKAGCGVLRPAISLQWPGSGSPTAYNYCQISDFNRYYWINEWIYEDRQWTATCTVDALATYKTEIGTSRHYVLRSSSEVNLYAIDGKYGAIMPPINSKYPITLDNWAATAQDPYGTGYFVVSLVKEGSNTLAGGLGYYIFTLSEFNSLISQCFTHNVTQWLGMGSESDLGLALKEFGLNIVKTVSDPINFINSAKWFPCAFAHSTNQVQVGVGPISTTASAYVLQNPIAACECNIDLPGPESFEPYLWQRIEPFRSYTLVIPPFGTYSLDAREVLQGDGIYIKILVDAISGIGSLQVTPRNASSDKVLVAATGQVGIPIEIAGANLNGGAVLGAAASTIGAIAAAKSGGGLAGAATSLGSLASAAGQGFYDVANVGTSGGMAPVVDNKCLFVTKYKSVKLAPNELGYPLSEEKVLNTLSGFILCADDEITLTGATPEEYQMVGEALTGGFFYE